MLLEEIKQMQKELNKRTQIEKEVETLICQCKFQEANKLLNTLDDNKVKLLLK